MPKPTGQASTNAIAVAPRPTTTEFASDQVKSVVTVVAKTHHYWRAHITGDERS